LEDPFWTVEIFVTPSQKRGTVFIKVQAPTPHSALIKVISEFEPLDEGEQFSHISVSGPHDSLKTAERIMERKISQALTQISDPE